MTKRRLVLLALSSAALAACGVPETVEPAPEGFPEPIYSSSDDNTFHAQAVDMVKLRADMLAAVNAARKVARKCGTKSMPAVPALKANTKLDTSSQAHATDMVAKNFFSHTGSDGSQPWDRMTRAGYSWAAAGENIAAGNSTVTATMTQWLNSAGHCENLMGANYTELGVGYAEGARYGYYWVQNFGKPR